MMVHATIREEIASGRISAARRVPERLRPVWTVALLFVDVMAVLAACYAAGLSSSIGPAACIVVCGALALCRTYQLSYAVRWYDEAYQIVVAGLVAFVPLWFLFKFVAGLEGIAALGIIVLATIFVSALHATLHLARHGSEDVAEAQAAYVSPEAQWRVGHGPYKVWKRGFDFALAAAGLIIASPLMLLIAVCIGIESGFPILFRQERVGRNGATFVMYKFRTMWQDAGQQWARPGDRRITNIGAILRRSSLDELPQLFNVLLGDMSLVGPRPEMPSFARDFRRTIQNYDARHIVTPGLTGWAQIYGKRNLQPADMPQILPYDLFYIEHASAMLDAIIIVKTAVEFLFHRAI
jgi:lipopolysaccharide/colanic/teichoic acid biosynthesis glycosyltransferase